MTSPAVSKRPERTACGTMRLDNDISVVANPYTGFDVYDSYNCGKSCEAGADRLSD